jgi:hypothetical protein
VSSRTARLATLRLTYKQCLTHSTTTYHSESPLDTSGLRLTCMHAYKPWCISQHTHWERMLRAHSWECETCQCSMTHRSSGCEDRVAVKTCWVYACSPWVWMLTGEMELQIVVSTKQYRMECNDWKHNKCTLISSAQSLYAIRTARTISIRNEWTWYKHQNWTSFCWKHVFSMNQSDVMHTREGYKLHWPKGQLMR